MNKFIIRNGLLVSKVNDFNKTSKDILVENGRIQAIEDYIDEACDIVDVKGCLVMPGFIDIHTHCYPKAFLGLEPDVLGIQRGATTIIDAGSSGCDTYEDFRTTYIDKAKTKVFTLLNVSKEGLLHGHELDCEDKINESSLKHIIGAYNDNIVGLKVRASASVVGEMGLKPIEKAAQIAHKLNIGLTVHVGNYPPALVEVLALLNKGDLITHAFHGKKGGILNEQKEIIPEAIDARKRGVLFDVGHGVASFSLRVYETALAQGFDTDFISTDLHVENYEGPVYNLAAVLNKLIACGEALEDAIHKCTSAPAKYYGLHDIGELKVGYIGDFSIMKQVDCDDIVIDSIGDSITLKQKLQLSKTIYSRGCSSEIFEHSSNYE